MSPIISHKFSQDMMRNQYLRVERAKTNSTWKNLLSSFMAKVVLQSPSHQYTKGVSNMSLQDWNNKLEH